MTADESTLVGSINGARSARSPAPSLVGKLRALFEGRPPILSRQEQENLYEQALLQQSKVFLKETSQQGRVKAEIYFKYLEAASRTGAFLFVLSIVLQNTFNICKSSRITCLGLVSFMRCNLSQSRTWYYVHGAKAIYQLGELSITGFSSLGTA
jgi:hypothetical protein